MTSLLSAQAPPSADAEEKSKAFIKSFTFKALDSDKGDFGLDYFIQWKAPTEGVKALLTAKGFLVADSSENTANALEFSGEIGWSTTANLPSGWAPPPPREIDPEALTREERRIYFAQVAASKNTHAFLRFSSEPKFTTTQDFRSHTTHIGPTVRASFPWPILFNKMFSVRTRLIHTNLGYEYIAEHKYSPTTKIAALESRKNLASVGLRTSLDIGSEVELDIEYRGAYFFEQTIPLNALPRYADFIYLRATFLKFNGFGMKGGRLAAIYSVGRLPPLYNKGHSLGGGFFLEF